MSALVSKRTESKFEAIIHKLLSKQQRVNLITLYEELFDKSITILNKKLIITDNAKKCL